MLNTSGLLYLSARAVSAAGNLLAVAIFSRLAGPAEYGHYVLIFAWSLIVYGFGAQWMRFAYFGVYHHERFGEYVASLARLLGAGIAIVALVLAALGLFGFFEPSFLIAVFALVCGITVYEAAFEVARTLLNARGASLSMILRTVLMVGFGSVSLYARRRRARARRRDRRCAPHRRRAGARDFLECTPVAFLARRFLAHRQLWLAAAAVVRRHRDRPEHRPACCSPIISGSPRSDLMASSPTCCGRVLPCLARRSSCRWSRSPRPKPTAATRKPPIKRLQKAFNACLAAASFGAAFFIVFGHVVLQAILQPEFIAPTRDLIPILAIAFAFTTMRNFYFAQVIYFTNASYLDLVVALLFLVVSTALSVVLVPAYGPQGAAIALMVACIVACVAFMVLGRRWYRMPIDLTALGVMPSLAILFVFGAHMTGELLPGHIAAAGRRCRRLRRVRRLCDPSFRPVALAVGGDRRRTHNGALADALITAALWRLRRKRTSPRRWFPTAAKSIMSNFSACRSRLLTQAEVDRRHHRGLRRALSLRGDAERLSRRRGARGAGTIAADLSGGLAVGVRQPHRAGAGAARPAGIAAGHRQRPGRGAARRAECAKAGRACRSGFSSSARRAAPKRRCAPPIRT